MTDMITHTPGPWKTISLDGHLYINPDREFGEYALICKMTGNHPAKEKNAELIASAPQLKADRDRAIVVASDSLKIIRDLIELATDYMKEPNPGTETDLAEGLNESAAFLDSLKSD